ncbi:MAG: amidase [Solirubrobacteraceae bacterium]|nr:amidase [Solirubrobacteraceae bacterium]
MGTPANPSATERRELAFAGVARQAAMVRAGEVTPRELVETALERIATLDSQLNAFRIVFAERALSEADEAGRRVSDGEDLPLLGVPIAVKDDTPVGGEARVCGSNAHGDPEPEDAAFVGMLRAAGVIVIGITRTPELAAWPFTETVHGGITRNPWDLQRTSGGSSGGSATAVAAALVPAATASDGAGSIRAPAACCGLFGLKVTRGAITSAPAEELFGGLSVYGFLTRGVADAALLYEVATGQPYVAAAHQDPPRLKIALSTRIPTGSSARLTADWRGAAESTAELLRSLGHEVVAREPPIGLVGLNVVARYLAGIDAEAKAVAHPERLERRTRRLARLGAAMARPAARARRLEGADAARVNAIFDDVDVVLGPTLPRSPLPVGRYEGRGAGYTLNGALRFVPFNGVWNHVGNPAAAVPAGFDADGLPLSVQLVARHGAEATLFSLAHELEVARPWADARPPVS